MVDCSVWSRPTGLLHLSLLPQLHPCRHPLQVPQHRLSYHGGGGSCRSPSSIDSTASLLPQRLLRSGPHGVQGPPLVMNPPDDRSSLAFSASTPVVLRILPKAGSSAPIGYIYDPDPSRNEGKGGYLTLLLSSSPTKAMRFSGIFAPTSRRTARRGPPSGPHPHRGSQSSGILTPFFRRGHSWYVFYGRVPPRSPSSISSST